MSWRTELKKLLGIALEFPNRIDLRHLGEEKITMHGEYHAPIESEEREDLQKTSQLTHQEDSDIMCDLHLSVSRGRACRRKRPFAREMGRRPDRNGNRCDSGGQLQCRIADSGWRLFQQSETNPIHCIVPICSSQCDLSFHNFFETVVIDCEAESFADPLHSIVFR